MSIAQTDSASSRKPLRLWPGVVIAVLAASVRFGLPLVMADAGPWVPVGGLAGMLLVALWWLFFSRAAWIERLGAIAVAVAAVFAARPLMDKSIAGGMMGMMYPLFAVPTILPFAFVAWAVATRRFSDGFRRVTMVATIVLACGVWGLVRTDGMTGAKPALLAWRWSQTAEEKLLAQGSDEPAPAAAPAPPAAPAVPNEPPPVKAVDSGAGKAAAPLKAAETTTEPAAPAPPDPPAEWPGFRGPNRDGVVHGPRIETDWSKSPPIQMWRRAIGPGWSSFAVHGERIYTQEQRGEDEIVSSYKLSTGEPVWRHRDPVRFWESNAGAGPRGTPTLAQGRVYAFGATGILNALDERTGAVVWSRNVSTDTGRAVPEWGYSSSPLVIDDVVIVAASGTLAAYDAATGKQRWVGPRQLASYSSPHRATIGGVTQVLLQNGSGAASIAPSSGAVLWQHDWELGGATIVQPAVTAEGDILINGVAMTGGSSLRRLAIAPGSGGWKVEERWTSNGLKPYFNDFVVHKGHAYGFDGNILSCIDLTDGKRKWKGGRYGNGQLVLLSDQDLLLILSEEGELALVNATPDGFAEVARSKAIEGKTWNHPAMAGGVLLVRNGEEMAAFRLSRAGS